MANYAAASALRARLAAHKFPCADQPFTLADWRYEQAGREARDSLARTTRWCAHVAPADGVSRVFFLRGSLEHVTERVHQIFGEDSRVLAIEPAPEAGPEIFSNRLSLGRT
jgi:hypothetical protein